MQAGFAKVNITPAMGTYLAGAGPAIHRPMNAVLDPIHLRALWLEHGDERFVIISFDWCFVAREVSERYQAILARRYGLLPRQVMCVSTHTHAGPAVGTYYDLEHLLPPRDYVREVDAAMLTAVEQARAAARNVSITAGKGRSSLPMNRRQSRDGQIVNGPNPSGPTLNSLPLCLLTDDRGKVVCCIYSISTHPVAVRGPGASADYPGMTCTMLDEHFGHPCALFLQGCAGDSRPFNLAKGTKWDFQSTHAQAKAAAEHLYKEVRAVLDGPLVAHKPRLHSAVTEVNWVLQPPDRAAYEAVPPSPQDWSEADIRYRNAQRQIALMPRGKQPRSVPILTHGAQLGEGLRLVAFEGEPLCWIGKEIEAAWPTGVTFPLGYCHGEAPYLPNSTQLAEGGYESTSCWEFGLPAEFEPGMEKCVGQAIAAMKSDGIA